MNTKITSILLLGAILLACFSQLTASNQAIGPMLLSPQDKAVLHEDLPRFSWSTPVPRPEDGNLEYRLKVVEIGAGQSPIEAIQLNMAHYLKRGLTGTAHSYGLDAMPLNKEMTYAWMVEAMSRGRVYARSKVWTFSFYNPDSLPVVEAPEEFVIPKTVPNAAIYNAEEAIGFRYDRCDGCPLPSYEILGNNRKRITLRGVELEEKGPSLLVLHLPRGCGLKVGKLYTLAITNGDKPKRFVIFTYLLANEEKQ